MNPVKKNKTQRFNYKAPMEITSTASKPFQKLALDIVGPLPITEHGNQFILTLQDDLTKYSQAYPIENHEAKTVADNLIKFISFMGTPSSILTDQGTEFCSNILKEVSKLFQIKQIHTTAYHPQSNGALERSHSTLKDYLKHYINNDQSNWDKFLPTAMLTYNAAIHATTKMSPYELVFGYKADLPSIISREPEFRYTYDNYASQLKYRLQQNTQLAKQHIEESKQKSKRLYDTKINKPHYKVGDKVLLRNEQVKRDQNRKLTPIYKGPYIVTEILKEPNLTISIGTRTIKVHKNRLKPYYE